MEPQSTTGTVRQLLNPRIDYRWATITAMIILGFSLPILTILFKVFEGPGDSWGHVVEFLLPRYVTNSAILVVAVGTLSLLFGVGPAWLVSRYSFPFRRTLEWALILPLAIPNYLTAYAYSGLFGYGGLVPRTLGDWAQFNMMNIWGLAFILAASLYPYVYVTTRSYFLHQSSSQLSSALLLGGGEGRVFWRIALPIARPAIAAGLFLVLMEVLNDYGAAYYYGVPTFTTAIFRSWFGFGEPETSVYLAALLCLLVFGLIAAERFQRRRKGYQTQFSDAPMPRRRPGSVVKTFLFLGCLTPVMAGFLLPFTQMSYWASITWSTAWKTGYLAIGGYSVLLAGATALLCVALSYLLIYGSRWSRLNRIKNLSKLAVLGYAVPGAVIAVGIMIPGFAFDRWLVGFMQDGFDLSIKFVVNGTIIGLLMAYSVRFLAVSHNPIEASTKKIGESMHHASQILGASKWKQTFTVHVPLLKTGLWSGALLVFVDVMKELPITLLMKPYNVMTLSTKAYEFASDERIAESALPSLMIIAVGLLPIIFLNKLIRDA